MKIKITLIAFFASALLFTSCMKNEVSPGIEQVRAAYAEFLSAQAQATLIAANAQAVLTNAQAQVQLAQAAINEATAAKLEAEADRLREQLAFDMQKWALELDSLEIELQKQIEVLQQQRQDAKDLTVQAYYTKYINALAALKTAQNNVADKLRAMVLLEEDLAMGKTDAIEAAMAQLAAAQANVAAIEAEIDNAMTILNDADAINARIAELKDDTLQMNAQVLYLAAQAAEKEHDADTEEAAKIAAETAKNTAKTARDLAQSRVDTAVKVFEAEWPAPQFWTDAKDSVTNAKAAIALYDTATTYAAWKAQKDIIDAGTTVIDARIADTLQSISDYNDSIDAYVADSAAAMADHLAAVAVFDAADADTATWHAELAVLTDSLNDQRARYLVTPTPALLVTITDNAADSTVLEARILIALTQTLPDAVADTNLSWAAFLIADDNLNNAVTGAEKVFGDAITAAQTALGSSTVPTGLYLIRANTLTDIANANLVIDDLWSDHLHVLSFFDELQAALVVAEAYKEEMRPIYEEYMDASFDDFLATLEATLATKEATYQTKLTAYNTAKAAFDAADKPYQDILKQITAVNAELAINIGILNAYTAAAEYNGDVIAELQAALTIAEGQVTAAETAIYNAQKAYDQGEVDYDNLQTELAELEAIVIAAQAQVDYWKALLDEALAN